MANQVTTNPLVLDTAGVVDTKPIFIRAIRVLYSADSDDVELSDRNGNSIFLGKATSAGSGLTDNLAVPGGIRCDGLTVTTVDGTSKVYVYLK